VSVEKEMKVVCDAIKNDEGYRITWEANIAMAFKDEWSRYFKDQPTHNEDYVHIISNNAAKNFIDLLTRELK